MDRNSIIGFVLLLLLGTGYIFWSNHEQKAYLEQKAADSVAAAARMQVAPDSAAAKTSQTGENALLSNAGTDSLEADTTNSVFKGQATITNLENDVLDLGFSSKGGYPIQATLKKYNNYSGGVVNYFNGDENKLSIEIPYQGRSISTQELYFTPSVSTVADGGQRLTMTADLEKGKQVVFYYVLPKDGYMMTAGFRLVGFGKELASAASLPFTWTTAALKTEKDMENERYYMQVHFQYKDGEDDYFTLSRHENEEMEKPVKWFSVRSHFFNSTIIADNDFSKGNYEAKENKADDSTIIVVNTNHFDLPVANAGAQYDFGFRWLISPNDYNLLKSYNVGLEEMISLGYGPFFFVKYISKWVIIPLFDFLCSSVGNVGLSIILLILIIRLFLSFFTYKSHLSSAKMKALKPELDKLKEKFGDNQQQMGMEQMKLYRTAGVSPLGGCLPMLLQMPFLLAVYYFIPTAIQLRQVPFLWSKDLSTYDSIMSLPFNIPMYGDHVSLFTLLMTATSLFLALYNKNAMTGGAPAGGGGNADMAKMMKYMPYVMPFMFLGWFNGMAAGLTLYYTCSNLISMGQQFVIQKFIIDEESIRAKIQERKSRPKKEATSKWQQRLEEMQKMQAEKTKNKR